MLEPASDEDKRQRVLVCLGLDNFTTIDLFSRFICPIICQAKQATKVEVAQCDHQPLPLTHRHHRYLVPDILLLGTPDDETLPSPATTSFSIILLSSVMALRL